eukprot:COSAG02_NODE_6278_length_3683_cov_3.575893_3_plen_421_part_00
MSSPGLLLAESGRREYSAPLGAWLCDLICCSREMSIFSSNNRPTTTLTTQCVPPSGQTAITCHSVLQVDEQVMLDPPDTSACNAVATAKSAAPRPSHEVAEQDDWVEDISPAVRGGLQRLRQELPGENHEDPVLVHWRVSAIERLAFADKELIPGTRLWFDGSEGTYRFRSKSRFGKNSHSIDFDESGVRSVHIAGHKDDGILAVIRAPSIHHDGFIGSDQSSVAAGRWRGDHRGGEARSARYLQSFVHLFGRVTSRNNPKNNLEETVPTWGGSSHAHEIDMYKRQIDNRRCSQLASLLPLCPTLVKLSLAYNHIGDEGALVLAIALPRLIAIKEVNLGLNAIADEGAIGLVRAASKCQSLRVLSLRSNDISDSGALAIAKLLPRCGALRELNLAHNGFGTVGLKALAAARPESLALRVE